MAAPWLIEALRPATSPDRVGWLRPLLNDGAHEVKEHRRLVLQLTRCHVVPLMAADQGNARDALLDQQLGQRLINLLITRTRIRVKRCVDLECASLL